MQLEIRRIILFTAQLEAMTAFYRDVVGLKLVGQEEGWRDFVAGACNLALHRGKAAPGIRTPKIVFYSADVAQARAALKGRGARMGKLLENPEFAMCDGKDPDGNAFQISSRR